MHTTRSPALPSLRLQVGDMPPEADSSVSHCPESSPANNPSIDDLSGLRKESEQSFGSALPAEQCELCRIAVSAHKVGKQQIGRRWRRSLIDGCESGDEKIAPFVVT